MFFGAAIRAEDNSAPSRLIVIDPAFLMENASLSHGISLPLLMELLMNMLKIKNIIKTIKKYYLTLLYDIINKKYILIT